MKSQLKNGQFTLSEHEIERLIEYAGTLRDRTMIKLLCFCGLRREEVVSIEIKNIDWDRRRLRIIGKGDKDRTIPVPRQVLTDMKFLIGTPKQTYLFPAKNRKNHHLAPVQLNRILAAAGEAAGIRNPNPKLKTINPHSLRHSFVKALKTKGVNLEVIQNILGHKSFKTTVETYGILTIDDIQEKFEEAIA